MDMKLSRNSSWRLTQTLLTFLGLWPFDKNHQQILLNVIALISIVSIIIPEVIKIVLVWGDVNAIAECAPMFFLHLQSIIKMTSYYSYLYEVKIIFKSIEHYWLSDLSQTEMKILQNYEDKSRKLIYAYAWMIFGCTVAITSTPVAQKLLDYIAPLNESRKIAFLYSVEYFVDPEKYKLLLFIHAYLISPFPSIVTVAFDTTYLHCVRHGCSMFAIMRHRMQIIANNRETNMYSETMHKKAHHLLSDFIKRHVFTLQYCGNLESLYGTTLLPIVVINTLALSITGFHTLIKLNDPPEAFKYGCFTCGCALHLFFYTYTGQDLTEHSESIYQITYDSRWYNVSPKLRGFFILIMMRSNRTCKITAGKLYILSIENFGKVIKLSVSYFTFLLSTQ